MNQMNKQITSEIEAAAEAGVDSRPVASTSRRRLIKLGASAVPVLATLTSQSALAASVCRSTSAWGSALLNPATSQAAHTFPIGDSWKISAWNSSVDSSGSPWAAFKTKYAVNGNPNSLTFADIYAKVGSTYMRDPSTFGFTSGNKVVGGLGNNNQSYFLVAMLNYALGQTPPTQCVSAANWLLIVADDYPTTTNSWTLSEIGMYLQNNFIVVYQ